MTQACHQMQHKFIKIWILSALPHSNQKNLKPFKFQVKKHTRLTKYLRIVAIVCNVFYEIYVYIYVRKLSTYEDKKMRRLTIPEEILLTAIWRLKDDAYGVTIRKKIAQITEQDIAYGSLYNILAQLGRKGYVIKSRSAPTSERGGRSKIYYRLTASGVKALQEARELQKMIWKNIPDLTKRVRSENHG